AHEPAVLCDDEASTARRGRVHVQGLRQGRPPVLRTAAAAAIRDHGDTGGDREVRYIRPRRSRPVPAQHIQTAGATAVLVASTDPARIRAGPFVPDLPGRGTRSEGLPATLHLSLRRGLGALHRTAR